MSTISGVTYDSIASTVGQTSSKLEASLKTAISELGDNPDQGKMLGMQFELQRWTMMSQLQSTLVKLLGDTLKEITNKL
ncbi:EscF/YscF/HrpA family type III secretion system needle major subunit [Acidovorax sp. CCYZU-2555]|uniref:EscF/YscF/HrpA family type III secretion system needle major subunit n=1 Tax=Acidovorax sp. CCYZU-2555 TaxID=2835042 RepID=UPI001BCCAD86|nr:EscF/YscF/HrpA family type III secretion system needle major subunit [Acidovorax sp. CCYZU-2555]MBS7777609.1 hypothetical protein [Acidovorax sp. CCYZU-2555]